jgi:hypothetical protein
MIASFDVPPQGDPASRHTVLIVEDEVLVRLDIAGYLRSLGFSERVALDWFLARADPCFRRS